MMMMKGAISPSPAGRHLDLANHAKVCPLETSHLPPITLALAHDHCGRGAAGCKALSPLEQNEKGIWVLHRGEAGHRWRKTCEQSSSQQVAPVKLHNTPEAQLSEWGSPHISNKSSPSAKQALSLRHCQPIASLRKIPS